MLIAAMLSERVIYGFADLKNNGEILEASKVYPFYGRAKFRGLAAKFCINPLPSESMSANLKNSVLDYLLSIIGYCL